jgi:hypothetical protein
LDELRQDPRNALARRREWQERREASMISSLVCTISIQPMQYVVASLVAIPSGHSHLESQPHKPEGEREQSRRRADAPHS